MTASVTVVIPTHNRVALLSRALDSVCAQTRPADEIIVVDDGSTDGTEDVVRQSYPGVRLLRQVHSGVSVARNTGIAAAGGSWIALLDSDDEWLPGKLEAQLRALRQHPDYRICHTEELWFRRGRRVNPMNKHQKGGGQLFQRCLHLCLISPSAVLIERELLDEVGLFDTALPVCEDYDLWLRICARCPVLFVDEPLVVKHGGHEDQLSRKYWGMDRFRIQALERVLRSCPLAAADARAARRVLVEKIDIYLLGARKRQKWDDVAHYTDKRQRWVECPS